MKVDIEINGMDSPEINSSIYGQMISDKGAKTIKWGKESFQQMGRGRGNGSKH